MTHNLAHGPISRHLVIHRWLRYNDSAGSMKSSAPYRMRLPYSRARVLQFRGTLGGESCRRKNPIVRVFPPSLLETNNSLFELIKEGTQQGLRRHHAHRSSLALEERLTQLLADPAHKLDHDVALAKCRDRRIPITQICSRRTAPGVRYGFRNRRGRR